MEREIKFKVLNKKTKSIVGYERVNNKGHFEFQKINRDEEWLLGINTGEDDLIRIQYTGLKDKKGIEIYEGDYHSKGNVVEFSFGSFNINGDVPLGAICSNIEIIGNIHENIN